MSPFLPRLRPGQQPTAAEYNALLDYVERASQVTGSAFGSVGVARGLGGTQILEQVEQGHWARIGAGDGAGAYSHQSAVRKLDQTGWTDLPASGPDTIWGTTTSAPAREVNGRSDVPEGTYLWVWPDPSSQDDPGFLFEWTPAGDATFLALLVGKGYHSAPFITYSWVRVKDTAGGGSDQITYDFSDLTSPVCGGPGCLPAYHVRNLDLPVWTGDFSPGSCCDPPVSNPSSDIEPRRWSVVRMRKGAGDWYVFGEHPWTDLFRRTGVVDADGEQAFLRYWEQTPGGGGAWADGQEVRLIVAG